MLTMRFVHGTIFICRKKDVLCARIYNKYSIVISGSGGGSWQGQ